MIEDAYVSEHELGNAAGDKVQDAIDLCTIERLAGVECDQHRGRRPLLLTHEYGGLGDRQMDTRRLHRG